MYSPDPVSVASKVSCAGPVSTPAPASGPLTSLVSGAVRSERVTTIA